jgi:hypothetical protein
MFRILGFAALLSVVSCATQPYRPYAREIKKKPGVEGTIALKPEYVPEDRTYADSVMAKNCGTNPINVLEEGEVQVGTSTSSTSKAHDEKVANGFDIGGGFKMLTGGNTDVKNTEKQSTVVALKEWHIVYNCKTEIATLAPKKTFKKK